MNVPAPVWCSKRRRDPSPLLRTCLINRPTYVTSCTWPLTIPMQERANCKHLRIRVHSRPLDECKNRLVNRWNTHETQSLARMKLPSQQQAAEFCWGAIQINGDGPERNEARLSSDQHEVESPHRSSFRIFGVLLTASWRHRQKMTSFAPLLGPETSADRCWFSIRPRRSRSRPASSEWGGRP